MPSRLRIRKTGFFFFFFFNLILIRRRNFPIGYSVVVCFSDLTVLSEASTDQDLLLHDCVHIFTTINYWKQLGRRYLWASIQLKALLLPLHKAGKIQNLHIPEIAQSIAEASLPNTPNPPVKYVGLKWLICILYFVGCLSWLCFVVRIYALVWILK